MAMETLEGTGCTKGNTEKIARSIGRDRTGRGDRRVGGRSAGRHAAGCDIVGTFGDSTSRVNGLKLSIPPPPALLLLLGRVVRHGVDTASLDVLILTVTTRWTC